ncbi:MAG TPA: lasso RiPP family leader peptide-containing protein [Thermoanaerobaculia bacterium]|nr:lasso RiPP family leader peptide-containing protein [Thermoanaerobaculia bacterium]
MIPHDESTSEGKTPPKREYIPPKLERLGTIRDLTHGLGKDGARDNQHPPGQNKSIA